MPLSLEMQGLALGQKLLISEWRTELLTLRLQLHLTSKSVRLDRQRRGGTPISTATPMQLQDSWKELALALL